VESSNNGRVFGGESYSMSEIQVWEIVVAADKAEAVFNAVKERLEQAKQSGQIVTASWKRSKASSGQV